MPRTGLAGSAAVSPGLTSCPNAHSHEVSQGCGPQLLHDAGTMNLNRSLADSEVMGHNLVGFSIHNQVHDFRLPGSELFDAVRNFLLLGKQLSVSGVHIE